VRRTRDFITREVSASPGTTNLWMIFRKLRFLSGEAASRPLDTKLAPGIVATILDGPVVLAFLGRLRLPFVDPVVEQRALEGGGGGGGAGGERSPCEPAVETGCRASGERGRGVPWERTESVTWGPPRNDGVV